MHPYLRRLMDLSLPRGHWALFGSGPLLVRGWIDDVGDLDVVSRGDAWETARTLGQPSVLSDGNEIVTIDPGVTVGQTWLYGDLDIDELIDTAEILAGIPCVRLEHIIAYKRISDRPKDRLHLAIIESKTH